MKRVDARSYCQISARCRTRLTVLTSRRTAHSRAGAGRQVAKSATKHAAAKAQARLLSERDSADALEPLAEASVEASTAGNGPRPV